MSEEFLQFVWRHRLFDTSNLKTADGEEVDILNPGQLNQHAGPDFFDARVRIGGTLWAGNVEIHTVASEWYRHGHTHDKAYANTILHVVYQHDKDIDLPGTDSKIPTLSLKDRIDYQLIRRYEAIKAATKWIPCEEFAQGVPDVYWSMWLERMAVERLEQRYEDIQRVHRLNNGDFKQTAFTFMLRYFGLRTNGPAFEQLAHRLSYSLIQKLRLHRLQVEALIFGQAGFLEEKAVDEYHEHLQDEYQFLKTKYALEPMHHSVWKFARMRPNSFPTVRLAQLAGLLSENSDPASTLLETDSPSTAKRILSTSEPSSYWRQHYRFGKISKRKVGAMGEQTAKIIMINALVPLRFALGKLRGDDRLCANAVRWWRSESAESNKIIRNWISMGVKPRDAADSQALIYLKRNYCTLKKCLNCSIGNRIVQKSVEE